MKSSPAKKSKTIRKALDWEAIEREYRIGQKSMRMIATEFNTTAGAISKKVKRYKWVQDKSAEVRQKTRAALLQETPDGNTLGNTPTTEDIDKAVQTNVLVIREHRTSIKASQNIVTLLQGQLHEAATKRDDIEEVIIDETKDEEGKADQKRRNRMLKAVSIPAHAGVLRDLTTAQKNLISLDRQAFNIDEDGGKDGAPTELQLSAEDREFLKSIAKELFKKT